MGESGREEEQYKKDTKCLMMGRMQNYKRNTEYKDSILHVGTHSWVCRERERTVLC